MGAAVGPSKPVLPRRRDSEPTSPCRRPATVGLPGSVLRPLYGPIVRIRTVYFCVPASVFSEVITFWEALLGEHPSDRSEGWCEYRVGEVNLGLLPVTDPVVPSETCVPVLEFSDEDIASRITRAKGLGAVAIIEGRDHPDWPRLAAVLADPWGYRFELTSFHG